MRFENKEKINVRICQGAISTERGKALVREGTPMELAGEVAAGFITWEKGAKPLVESVVLPAELGAYESTVRLHEMLHAAHSPGGPQRDMKKFGVTFGCANAVEDGFVHVRYWPQYNVPAKTHRNAMAVALKDLRQFRGSKDAFSRRDPRAMNALLMTSLRSLAIGLKAAQLGHSCRKNGTGEQVWSQMIQMIRGLFPAKDRPTIDGVLGAIKDVLALIDCNKRKAAMQSFQRLLNVVEHKVQQTENLEEGKDPGTESQGEQSLTPMITRELEWTDQTSADEFGWAATRSGMRININRVPAALTRKSTHGLFNRELPIEPQGVVLIDASGSMDVNIETLTKLCKLAPGATVAFYSGFGRLRSVDGQKVYGELVVFAKDGKRATEIPAGCKHGNNGVDLFAMQWMLDQPGPHYFVTDQEFCGGPYGQDRQAHLLLSLNRDDIQVIDSVADAMQVFGQMEKSIK